MKPDPKLIDSMAMRYRHDFGFLDQTQKDSIRVTMTQLWEEVVGLGFYKPKKTNNMNKIERAISDIKSHIKSLDMDILVLETERKAFKKQLDALEKIQDDKSIPHDETIPNIPTWDKSHPGGFGLSLEPNGTGIRLTNTTTDKGLLSSINIDMPNGEVNFTNLK